MEKKIKVIKRDGKLEDFDPSKLERVLKATGLSNEEVQKVLEKINQWLSTVNSDSVSSLSIRDKVVEQLKLTNAYAFGLYTWYEKSKDKKTS